MPTTGKTDYLENKILDLLNGTSITAPTQCYMALYEDYITDSGSSHEFSGGGYAPTAVNFTSPSAGVIVNDGDVVFPTPSAPWGEVKAWAVKDGTSGNILYYFNYDVGTGPTIDTGNVVKFTDGSITITEA